MKKTLLLIVAVLIYGGSVFSQGYQTHWPEFDYHNYKYHQGLVAAIMIDGVPVTVETEGWQALEVAPFVANDILRGNNFYLNNEFVLEYDDPYPVTWDDPIYYTDAGEDVYFKMYNHITGVEYTECVVLQYGEQITIHTGESHAEGWDNPDDVIFLNFTSPTPQPYTLDITGYGESDGGYYLIASPVTDPITPSAENGFLTNDFDLYYFDQNGDADGNEWFNYEANPFTIQSKKGYLYASQTDTQLQFAGTACTDGNVPLEYSEANPSNFIHGWNLIGNPLAEDATISQACYVMKSDGTDLEPAAAGKLIPAMNGVFVKATGADQSVTFTPSTTSNEGAKIDINVLKDRGATIDRAIVRLGEGGSLPKFQLNPENTKIFIHQDGDDYAVVSSNENEIPVSFKAASNGTYTLNVAPQNTEMEYLHLIDNMTGANIDLLVNPNYTFEAHTGDYACRFTLVLSSATGIDEHFAFYNGTNWTISNDGEAVLQVVDVMGRILNSKEICGNAEINISQPAGVYMLRLVNGSDVKVQKVIVR